MIVKHSKNQYLIKAYKDILPRSMFFLHFVVREQVYRSIYQRHKGICDAIVDRNEDLAAERIVRHLKVSLTKSL